MNQKIKELAVEADNYAYKMNPEQDSYGRSANPQEFQRDRYTKFAELIVKECADVARQQADRSYMIHTAIKQHFGIEE